MSTYTIRKRVAIRLDRDEQTRLRRFINLALVGDEEVNETDAAGRLVGKYPDREDELCEAHNRVARSREVGVVLDFNHQGRLVGARFDLGLE